MNNPRNIVNTKGYYCATVHGYSMYPLLCNHRDSVYIEKANSYKKYDVVLFERPNGKLVLHRIIKIRADRSSALFFVTLNLCQQSFLRQTEARRRRLRDCRRF